MSEGSRNVSLGPYRSTELALEYLETKQLPEVNINKISGGGGKG